MNPKYNTIKWRPLHARTVCSKFEVSKCENSIKRDAGNLCFKKSMYSKILLVIFLHYFMCHKNVSVLCNPLLLVININHPSHLDCYHTLGGLCNVKRNFNALLSPILKICPSRNNDAKKHFFSPPKNFTRQ